MKPKVYITRRLPEIVVKKLQKVCEVRMWEQEDAPVPREVLLKEIKNADGLLCLLTDEINKEVLECGKNLKIIANMAVGFDNIDISSATEKGIIVTNTPGVLTETTADLTFSLMMATARRIVESDNYLRAGKWKTWSPMQLTGQDIHGANLGVIGMGRIAKAFVKRAVGFDMNIQYYNRSRKNDMEEAYGIKFSPLEKLLKESDFICIFLPYSKEVHHLIGIEEMKKMKKTAILINTARGGIVDESALYHALTNNIIWSAGLDVFEQEPVSEENPLLELSNLVTLPHIGSASKKTRLKMADMSAENVILTLSGKQPITPVNHI